MKFYTSIVHLVALGCLSSVPTISATDEDDGVLDTTNHNDIVFDARLPPDGTYMQAMDLVQTSTIDIGGMKMDTVMNIKMADELTVVDRPEGGKVMDMIITRMEMSMETFGSTFTCDSKNTEKDSSEEICKPIESVDGMAFHFIVDDEGTIAESSDDENHGLQMGPTDQIQQTSRLLRLLPTHPIQPGDAWPEEENMEGLGTFTGTGKMLGYKNYKDHECAVIEVTGNLEFDDDWMKNMIEQMGVLPVGDSILDGFSIDSGSVTYTMYWDNTARLARFAKIEQSFIMHMKNPIDNTMMTIPVVQVIGTAAMEK